MGMYVVFRIRFLVGIFLYMAIFREYIILIFVYMRFLFGVF